MHQALYRKWRPRNFDEVCGQEQVTSILKYECQAGAFSHAYLFCGSRGTGKTSCAKILAKAVNCEHPTSAGPCGVCTSCRSIDSGSTTDVLEMDAASNNGVDDIRDIRDEVVYTPADLKYRVYIIDEVHMLSQSAFNALLKTLEEPPEHVIFILATTELQKLPATIISRCQRFDFRRISTEYLSARLMFIAQEEEIPLDEAAAQLIARQAQGGMRDAISLLELCAGARQPITVALVTDTLGITGREGMCRVVTAIAERNFQELFEIIQEMVASSKDLAVFWQELISYYRDMLVVCTTRNAATYLDLTDSEQTALEALAARFHKETLLFHLGWLEDALFAMQKAYAIKRTVAEVTLVRMCDPALDTSSSALLARMARLEEQWMAGGPALAGTTAAVTASPSLTEGGEHATPSAVQTAQEKTSSAVGTQASLSEQDQAGRQESAPTVAPDAPASNQEPGQAPRQAHSAASPSSASDHQRVLRPLRVWAEAVARVMESAPWSGAHLKQAKAYLTEAGQVVIKFGDDFSRQMAMDDATTEALRKALSICLGHALTREDIQPEVETPAGEAALIDLIIEAADPLSEA